MNADKKSFYQSSVALTVATALTLLLFPISVRANSDVNSGQYIVESVIQNINDVNVLEYIQHFNSTDQVAMTDYLNNYGSSEFFEESHIDLLDIKKLSKIVGIEAAQIGPQEVADYQDIDVYYTKEYITTPPDSEAESGIVYKAYVVGITEDSAEIVRICAPNLEVIVNAGEGFLNQDSVMTRRALLYAPSTVKIYFTKSENQAYYGTQSKDIDFETYLKNGIPSENSVSYYATLPQSLISAALAYKMYGWYCSVYPRRNYAPYYADMLDNSNDQNFLGTAYGDLLNQGAGGPAYQSYVDSLLDDIDGIAVVKGEGGAENQLFPTQYRSNAGTQGSGILNQIEARSLESDFGFDYQDIIHYYYDYSSATDGNAVVFRSHL